MVTRAAIAGALVAAMALSGGASAQEPRPGEGSTPLELTRPAEPERPIVRPESDRGQAMQNAASAATEYEQRQRDEVLMRERTRPSLRRPDLGYDVTGGIQQRNLRR